MTNKMSTLKSFVDRAEILNSAFKVKYKRGIKNHSTVKLQTKFKVVSAFSENVDLNNIELPFKVSGRLITAGPYFEPKFGEDVLLEPEELMKTLDMWNVKIMKSHAATASVFNGEDVSIDNICGTVTSVRWNDIDQGIDWEGYIADEDLARKIAFGLVEFGSVTFKNTIKEKGDKLYFTEIEPLDFSLVFNPRDKNASINAGGL